MVINLLQPVRECRFNEFIKLKPAPVQIKAESFTGGVKHHC